MTTEDYTSWTKLLGAAGRRLQVNGVEAPRREARLLLGYALNVSEEQILADRLPPMEHEKVEAFKSVVTRRALREPFAYITGRREFWSLEFAVAWGVLIPRPETELLVEQALKYFPDPRVPLRVLDLGTGSGCLLLSFLSERPAAQGLGVDISGVALDIAHKNAVTLGLSHRARIERSDWFENVSGTFDVIFINPPYIASAEIGELEPEVRTYEPQTALDGGPDGIGPYRQIADGLEEHLAAGGRGFFEIGQGQAAAVASLLSERGLKVHGIVADLAGIPRCVIAAKA